MNKAMIFIGSALLLLVVFVFGSAMFKGQEAEKIEKAAAKIDMAVFDRGHSMTVGSPDAKVTITEFFDPGCETCRAFHPFGWQAKK